MRDDLATLLWKEWRCLARQQGNRTRVLLTLATPLLFFGLWFPWESGLGWLRRGPPSAMPAVVVPLLIVLLTVPDAFAGERERHTLATLLASRLPDRTILLGKLLFAVGLSLVFSLAILVLGLAVANLAHGEGIFLFYSPRILITDLALGLLVSLLGAGLGTIISLRSATVQQAQQTLAAILFLPPTVLGPILLIVAESRPQFRLRNLLAGADPEVAVITICAVLATIDVLLLWAAHARFRRQRLLER